MLIIEVAEISFGKPKFFFRVAYKLKHFYFATELHFG